MPFWMIPIAVGASMGSSFLSSYMGGGVRKPLNIPNLLPAPKIPIPQISNVDDDSQRHTLTYAHGGIINSMTAGLPIPILGGKCRVGVQLVSAYVRSTQSADVLYALYAVAEGELEAVVLDDSDNNIWLSEDLRLIETDGSWDSRTGTKAQTVMSAFQELHQIHEVNQEIKESVYIVCHFDDDEGVDNQFTNSALPSYSTGKNLNSEGTVVDDAVVPKFGAACGKFPGNVGDYCECQYDTAAWHLRQNDFTIDVWLRMELAATAKFYTIVKWQNTGTPSGWGLGLKTDAADASLWQLQFYNQSAGGSDACRAQSTTFTGADDTWYHMAFVRYGGKIKFFWNGADITDYDFFDLYATSTYPASGTPYLIVGLAYASTEITGETNWFGYMDDLRLINGKALWNREFTVPSAAIASTEYTTAPTIKTKGECDSVIFTFSFPNGLYDSAVSTYTTTLTIDARFRDTVWTAGEWGWMRGNDTAGRTYAYPQLWFKGGSTAPVKRQTLWEMKCITYDNRSNASTFTTGEEITGGTSGAVGYVAYDYDLGGNTGVIYLGPKTSENQFQENEEIEGGSSGYTADVDAVPSGYSPIVAGKATYYNKSSYEFMFRWAGTVDYEGKCRYCVLSTMDEMLHYALKYPNTALLSLEYSFLGSTVNQIGPVSVLADRGTQALPTWGGGTSNEDTSIPAWFALDILTNTRYGRKTSIDDIDQTSWEAWETHTEAAVGTEKRVRWNGIIDSQMEIEEALSLVARVGRARIVKIGSKRYAMLEKTGTVSHLFTAGNMQRDSFVAKHVRNDQRPHGYKISYLNEDNEYRKKEYLHKGPEYETTTQPLNVPEEFIVGITNEDEAKRLAILTFQLETFPSTMCVFSTGVDAVSVLPGDIARVIPDTPYSFGGRVVDADFDEVLIDRAVWINITVWMDKLEFVYRDADTDTIYTHDVEIPYDTNPAPQIYNSLPDMVAHGNASGGQTDDSHRKYASYAFEGVEGDVIISAEFYDVNHADEIEILINGQFVDCAAVTSDNSWGSTEEFTLHDAAVKSTGINILQFANSYNRDSGENYTWGVRNVICLSHGIRAKELLKLKSGNWTGNPSEGTASGSPSQGTPSSTPSASPSQGTPSGSPSAGTPSGSPSEGTPSEGTPSGSPSASPSAGTPSGSPSEGTPSGTPSASPSGVTWKDRDDIKWKDRSSIAWYPQDISGSPSEGTPSGSPSEGTPSEGTPSSSPSEGTPSGDTPSEGTPSGSPSAGTPSATPSSSPSEGTPSEGTPSEGAPSTETPAKYDVYALYHKGLVGHAGAYRTEYRIMDIDRSEDVTFKISAVEYCYDAYFHPDYGATEI